MDNKQLYQLEVCVEAPWYISRVEVKKDDEEIWVELGRQVQRFVIWNVGKRVHGMTVQQSDAGDI